MKFFECDKQTFCKQEMDHSAPAHGIHWYTGHCQGVHKNVRILQLALAGCMDPWTCSKKSVSKNASEHQAYACVTSKHLAYKHLLMSFIPGKWSLYARAVSTLVYFKGIPASGLQNGCRKSSGKIQFISLWTLFSSASQSSPSHRAIELYKAQCSPILEEADCPAARMVSTSWA